MERMKLLLAGMAVSGVVAANAQTTLYDFESGKGSFGGEGWGQTITSVDNPYNCGNTSAKCVKVETEGYGVAGFSGPVAIDKKILAVDVFSYVDAMIRCNESYKNDLKQSVKGRVWTTLYFDFTGLVSGPASAVSLGVDGESGTCFIDNIRLVDAVGDTYDCDQADLKADLDYTFGRVQIGGAGFVSGLLSVPGKIKLARTDVGGAYKWNPSNCEWVQMFDFVSKANIGMLSVEAMAVDPNNVDHMYFLCACRYYSGQKTAVLSSTDGGKSFKEVELTNLPFFADGNGDGRNAGERLVIDPNNANILFCGSRLGTPLVTSTDGGATWTKVASFPDVYDAQHPWPWDQSPKYPSTSNKNGVCALAFDADMVSGGKTTRIYAGVSKTGDNVFVSEDGGATWKSVKIDGTLIPIRMKVVNGELLITMADKHWGASAGKIYRYNPTTGVATDISATKLACSDIVVKPSDPNYMVTATNNTWYTQKFANGEKGGEGDLIFVTKDGGKTWVSLQDKMLLNNNDVTWVTGSSMHWCGGICIDPNDENKASFTSGNGIWSCNNIWEVLENADAKPIIYFDVQGVEECVPLDMLSIEGKAPMSVIGDYTGFVHENVAEYAPIHKPSPGTTYGIGYAAKNPNIIARVSASEYAAQNSYITLDGGATWENMGNVAAYHVGFSADGKKMFICTKNGALKVSTDNGATWGATSITSGASYVIGDPENADVIYATTKTQKDGWIDITTFNVSTDGGKTFTSIEEMEFNSYSRITVVPGHEGLVYIPASSKGALVSTDYGKTFTQVPGLTSCDGIGVGKGLTAGSYTLYAFGNNGMTEGYFRSTDEGKTWLMTNDSKHNFGGLGNGQFIIGDMNTFGRFYVGTTGMGIVYADETSNFEAPVYKCYTEGSVSSVEDVVAEAEDVLVVSPNPTVGSFSLNEDGQLVIVNTLGAVVFSGEYVAGTEIGDNLPAGIYVARINGKVQKIVKQ